MVIRYFQIPFEVPRLFSEGCLEGFSQIFGFPEIAAILTESSIVLNRSVDQCTVSYSETIVSKDQSAYAY